MHTFPTTSRLEPLRKIGEGGFGVVYEALDRHRSARVAVKVLRHVEGRALYRFKREFRAVADLPPHPNRVTLHELLTDGNSWFFTMELIDGDTCTSYVRPHDGTGGDRHLDEQRLRHVLPQLVDALGSLHHAGMVHRDIKPSNVLVTKDGRLVLLDFGLVSEHGVPLASGDSLDTSGESSVGFGTPSYMAPEQGTRGDSSPLADWYSVGVIVYEALTGQRPPRVDDPALLAPALVAAPADLTELCLGLLHVNPDLRRPAVKRFRSLASVGPMVAAQEVPSANPELLVGRDAHLAVLQEAFQAAIHDAVGAVHTDRPPATVVVMVSGLSGMGKSALLQRFLADLRAHEPDCVVLSSRCYERESTPYKAIDPQVDVLSRYLSSLRDIEVARLLPRDAALLARMFPVLRIVDEIRGAPEHGTTGLDSIALRRRAAAALRDLLFEIAVRVPLVLCIDDAQWGDADSAALLEELLQPPDAPPMLLIVAYRSEDTTNAPVVSMLHRLGRVPDAPELRTVTVGPLSAHDARRLAARVAGGDEGVHGAVAEESGGSPFFIHELAHHASVVGQHSQLSAVITGRVATLPEATQRLIACIALSAQAIPTRVAATAAGLGAGADEALQALRGQRLLRVSGHADARTFEPYHDRIREAVLSRLHPDQLRTCHGWLATAWEQVEDARPETLTTHFLGAGDTAKTQVYAALAAERATQALAFERAADLYALLARLATDVEQRRTFQVALGDALVNCGRGFEAATSYLHALPSATGREVIDLERRAAAELIRAGYLDEATSVLGRLLPKVGIRPPRSDAHSIATVLAYRAAIAARGLTVRPTPEEQIPRAVLDRLDVLIAIAPPFTLISLARGLTLNVKLVWSALQAGEPKRAAVALAIYAASVTMNGTKTMGPALEIVRLARELATPVGDRWTLARTDIAEGICRKVSGFWKQGIACLERAIDTFNHCPGARWEIETSQTLRHDAMVWTGDWRKLGNELPVRRNDAQQRGDRYSEAQIVGRLSPVVRLRDDRLEDAMAEAESARGLWTRPHFNLQHRAALCGLLDIDLYGSRYGQARERLLTEWRSLRGTLSLFQNGRIEAEFYRARIALALAADGHTALYAEAARVSRRLRRERAAWADALAVLIDATIAHGRGDLESSVRLLDTAARELTACDMHLYAAAAQYRRGRVVKGDEGAELVDAAVEVMRGEDVVAPDKVVDWLAPGAWRTL